MSTFEIAVFVFVFTYLLSVLFMHVKKQYLRIGLIISGMIASAINLLVDGYRWQMLPVYIFLIILLLIEILMGKSKIKKKGLRIKLEPIK